MNKDTLNNLLGSTAKASWKKNPELSVIKCATALVEQLVEGRWTTQLEVAKMLQRIVGGSPDTNALDSVFILQVIDSAFLSGAVVKNDVNHIKKEAGEK